MSLDIRFAIASDLHIGLPHTIWDHPSRFHLIEVSIPALEQVLDHISQLDIDFLLLPGDLTQHGERDNHAWLAERLQRLSFPCYVIPGNHDVVLPDPAGDARRIGSNDFAKIYQKFGYDKVVQDQDQATAPRPLCYSTSPVSGLRLIGLNSNQFDHEGKLVGYLDSAQLDWLETELSRGQFEATWVMIHHNVLEHLPDQAQHPLGRRYILGNAERLKAILKTHAVSLIFTGHLHVQDVTQENGLTEITTGSLVSYPHPYRLLHYKQSPAETMLSFESFRIGSTPDWPQLQQQSRDWMGDRATPFMAKLLSLASLDLSEAQIAQLTPHLRYFWADIAEGDREFNFEQFPAELQGYFKRFGIHQGKIDNAATLAL
ncbi:MAG: metallophosphoesterase [Synechococcales cyanobacterium RM1_1_8]|nr:metallophosphoesterase [Synechococcales cyanobacterium RM1_1_8]